MSEPIAPRREGIRDAPAKQRDVAPDGGSAIVEPAGEGWKDAPMRLADERAGLIDGRPICSGRDTIPAPRADGIKGNGPAAHAAEKDYGYRRDKDLRADKPVHVLARPWMPNDKPIVVRAHAPENTIKNIIRPQTGTREYDVAGEGARDGIMPRQAAGKEVSGAPIRLSDEKAGLVRASAPTGDAREGARDGIAPFLIAETRRSAALALLAYTKGS